MQTKKTYIKLTAALLCLVMMFTCFSPFSTAYALVRSPRLNLKYLSAVRNTSYKLNVYNMQPDYKVFFSSNNTSGVAVRRIKSKSCRLKAKNSGSATITAEVTDEDDHMITALKCNVTVSPLAVSIKFNKHKVILTEGSTKTIKAVTKPNISSEQPKYISDDPEIASVSSTGVVTAVSEGKTTIRAFITNKKAASYTVIVAQRDSDSDDPDDNKPEPSPTPTPSIYFNIK